MEGKLSIEIEAVNQITAIKEMTNFVEGFYLKMNLLL